MGILDFRLFTQEEMLSFFAVLVRYSVLIALLPIVGNRFVPVPVKILLSLAISIALFPALVTTGQIHPGEAAIWGSSGFGIVGTVALEALVGFALGFTAKLAFESVSFGANLVGTFMGFAIASSYDPTQDTQTQVIAELQIAIGTLIFLAIDGHHAMLKAALGSYQIVGLGKAGLSAAFSQRLTVLTAEVIRFGVQMAAPVAVTLFAVNIAFGVLAKAMPQLNVLVLSFAVSALIGFIVMFLSIPEFQGAAGNVLGKTGDWMSFVLKTMAGGH